MMYAWRETMIKSSLSFAIETLRDILIEVRPKNLNSLEQIIAYNFRKLHITSLPYYAQNKAQPHPHSTEIMNTLKLQFYSFDRFIHAVHPCITCHWMWTRYEKIIIFISLLFRMIVSGVRATRPFPISAAGQPLLCVSVVRRGFFGCSTQ